jgi:integrase
MRVAVLGTGNIGTALAAGWAGAGVAAEHRRHARRLLGCLHRPHYRACLTTIYAAGLRLGEGVNLSVSQIDSARMQLHIRGGKGNKDRAIPLPPRTLALLRAHWLTHRNPIWLNSKDAEVLDVKTGDLLKINTEIGYFVDKVWVTEGIKPGVIACSHHLGRWRLQENSGGERWSTALVDLQQTEPGKWKSNFREGPERALRHDRVLRRSAGIEFS